MAFYDNFYKRSGVSDLGRYIIHKQHDLYINLIKKHTNKKSENIRVLEIGPGKGFFAKRCNDEGFKYQAIEANKKMCEALKKSGFTVHNDYVPPINLSDKFDVIFMAQVLEHMKDRDEALKLFQNCQENLKKQGLLIISVPDIRFWKENFWGADYTHNYPLSIYSLQQIFVDFDMSIKYTNLQALFFRGVILTKLLYILMQIFYFLGLIKLVWRRKAYKIKNLFSASCIVVGQKN